MNNWKIRVSNEILTNATITHKAFYLYVNLKVLAKGNSTLYTYKDELLDLLMWSKNDTLKRYLKELKKKEIIDFPFKNFPVNKPLRIDFLVHEENKYTQIDIETINKVKSATVSIIEKTKDNTEVNHDLKELALRLFYLYEMFFNPMETYARPTYMTIKKYINAGEKYVKLINNTFNHFGLVRVIIGKRHNTGSRRMNNRYIPIWNRK